MKGAIIFLLVFAALLLVTLAAPGIPPGKQVYDAVVGTETDYPVLGIAATTLVSAVINGVIYGFIVWLIYDLTWGRKERQEAREARRMKKEQQAQAAAGTPPSGQEQKPNQ
ncbi:MAG TPA: hypothetical protein VMB46_03940 [Methanomassiliicoccales archaeon]|nr:hypothetical protein [Methanomassiliicoccales archaeon]